MGENVVDTVDKETRSRIMSSVGQKDTGLETMLRAALHKAGLRYRLCDRKLPGSPDLVFSRFGAVIFVHGCYWHSHGCYKSSVPKSRRKFWVNKFSVNRQRDEHNIVLLRESGWRVMIVWECALVGKHAFSLDAITELVRAWLMGTEEHREVPGSLPETIASID